MKIDVNFNALDALRIKMGAELIDFNLEALSPRDIELEIKINEELYQGIEINSLEEVTKIGDFLADEEGRQYILYIKDTMQSLDTIRNDKAKAKKFHIAWCRTLDRMKQEKRFERYVKTIRDDGKFTVDAFLHDRKISDKKIESDETLPVCKNCLDTIHYQEYDKEQAPAIRNAIVIEFDIKKFLEEYSSQIRYLALPSGSDVTTPLAEYTREYFRISKIIKKNCHYKCQECNVSLFNHKGLLHAHHIDHNKTNNKPDNFLPICVLCHQQNHHKHMHVKPEYIETIKKLRKEQNL